VRSVIVDVLHGEKRQGGSTITQQFVKNAVLTREKSIWRKLKEIILSIEIEARFSKQDILKLYLNEIPYGRNAYGIQAAAQTYFNKEAKDLTLAESAYLAALPQAPTYYNPQGAHVDALHARAKTILRTMKDQGYITDEQLEHSLEEKVEFTQTKTSISAPHFVHYVEDYLADKYGERTLQQGGLKVYTTLDPELQKMAEDAVSTGVEKFAKRYNANNAALVATDPKTGQILAMVGSKDYFGESQPVGCKPGQKGPQSCVFEPNVNVSTTPQQPGSSFKPYVYLTAFGKDFKYAPASLLMDVTTNFGNFGGKDYIPHNYNGASNGPVSMRKALAGSLNVPAVKALALVGVERAIQTSRDLGVTSPMQNCGLSLVLGGCEVKLVDHVAAFGAIANLGERHDKTAIMKVVDQEGKILEEYDDKSRQVVDPQAAYELISIMTDNSARAYVFGSNSPLHYPGKPVACKTGTTQEWRDGWTMCFTTKLSVGVWAGNNNNSIMRTGADGVLVAAPIVNEFMKKALVKFPAEEFRRPQGIEEITVDALSGMLPGSNTPETKKEVFADYAVPTERDTTHSGRKIDRTTGLPADEFTLPENVEQQTCLNLRSERPDDPNWERPVQSWLAAHGGCRSSNQGESTEEVPRVTITRPGDDATINDFPFDVEVSASSSRGIAKVDLLLDGDLVGTDTTSPFEFTVEQSLEDGHHTLTARAVDSEGASSSTSTTITAGNEDEQPLSITSPASGEVLSLPATVSASSGQRYQQVTFYYQTGGTTKVIDQSEAKKSGRDFNYSTTWNEAASPGTYRIFARSNTGAQSSPVTVVVGP
jgi:membrane peptidoglycan carboxypeptidase